MFISSSTFLNGPFFCRYSTIRPAVLAPIPGSRSRSAAVAVLMLITSFDGDLAAATAGACARGVCAAYDVVAKPTSAMRARDVRNMSVLLVVKRTLGRAARYEG